MRTEGPRARQKRRDRLAATVAANRRARYRQRKERKRRRAERNRVRSEFIRSPKGSGVKEASV